MALQKLDIYQMSLRFLGEARLATLTDDVEARYALDDSWLSAPSFVLRQAPWQFALKTVALSSSAGSLGYTFVYTYPNDWLRTHALFVLDSAGRECPVDLREQQAAVLTNASAPFYMRYVASGYADPSFAGWPEHFAECVAAYLAFLAAERITGDSNAAPKMSKLFSDLLPEAIKLDGEAENRWLPFQRTGAYLRGARHILQQGYWRFALKDTGVSVQNGTPAAGFAFSFGFPADWLRSHKLYLQSSDGREVPLDIREMGAHWSTNIATFNARYVSSTLGIDATQWPEPFHKTVLAWLEFESSDEYEHAAPTYRGDAKAAPSKSAIYQDALGSALADYSEPEWFWKSPQLDGRMQRGAKFLLGQGFWRFAMASSNISATSGTPQAPFVSAFAKPADWLRTYALYLTVASDTRQFPFDIREHQSSWSTNATAFTVRYISSTVGLDPTKWTEAFTKVLRAWVEYEGARREDPKAEQSEAQEWQAVFEAAVASDCDGPDAWLRYQLDGTFQRIARTMVDQGYWRFAIKNVPITTVAGGNGGFVQQAAIPADWSRTRSLYRLTTDKAPTGAGERRPFKVREQAGFWYTDAANFYAEYVSTTLAMDSTKWPDHYMRAVLRALHFDESTRADNRDQKDDLAILKDALDDTLDSEATAPDPWLAYQLDGTFDGGIRAVLARGFWWWATKTLDIDVSSQETAQAQSGFPYRYALPADWMRTRALYVAFDGRQCPINIRESNEDWSTDASAWTAEYLSTDVLDPTTWPEAVAAAVLAYLDLRDDQGPPADQKDASKPQVEAAEYQRLLADALAIYSLDEHPWLRFQLDARYIEAVKMCLEKGRWRWAVKTVILTDPNNQSVASFDPAASPPTIPIAGDPADTQDDGSVSTGYACRMPKPTDWMRTLRVYFSYRDGVLPRWLDIDYRDELGAIHCNYNPVRMRYVSRIGLDSTRHPSNFRDALMTYLEYIEARADPKLANVAAKKLEFYETQCKEAETLDDESDVPRVQNASRFVSGRYGRGSIGREQGWLPW